MGATLQNGVGGEGSDGGAGVKGLLSRAVVLAGWCPDQQDPHQLALIRNANSWVPEPVCVLTSPPGGSDERSGFLKVVLPAKPS